MSEAEYNRTLDDKLVNDLRVNGRLGYLLHDTGVPAGEPYALDIQLRKNNEIMFYRGTTRLLVVKLFPNNRGRSSFKINAAPFYRAHSACADSFQRLALMGKSSPMDAGPLFRKYLISAMSIASPSHYDNHAEGYWQNRICHRFGREFRIDDPWLVVDRECVLEFGKGDAKEACFTPIRKHYGKLCKNVANAGSERWRQIVSEKGLGDELDMLAVAPNGDLLAIELKYGRNAHGIYRGPVQVGIYAQAMSRQINALGPAIVELVKQKVSLGLLPEAALNRLPPDGFTCVRPILAVADANPESACWPRLAEVMEHVGEVDMVTVGDKSGYPLDLPGIMANYLSVSD